MTGLIWKGFRQWEAVKYTVADTSFSTIYTFQLKLKFYHWLSCFPWSDSSLFILEKILTVVLSRKNSGGGGAGGRGTSSAHNLTAQVRFIEITTNLNMQQKCFWHIVSGLKGQDLRVSSRFILIKSHIIFYHKRETRKNTISSPGWGGCLTHTQTEALPATPAPSVHMSTQRKVTNVSVTDLTEPGRIMQDPQESVNKFWVL